MLGKSVSDLQEGVSVNLVSNKIYGTVKYVTGYTGFDASHEELQSGNYLVLYSPYESGAVVQAKVVGGTVNDYVTLDSDGILISRITSSIDTILFKETKDGVTKEVAFDISNLVLETA